MKLKSISLTSENINELYPENERGFPRPFPVDGCKRTLAWVREMLTKGFHRKVVFDETGQELASIEYMPIEEALDNIIGENINAIHCLWDETDSDGGEPTRLLLDVVEQESREVGRGVSLVGHRMGDLLIQRGYRITNDPGQLYFLAVKAFKSNQNASLIPRMRTIPQVELIKGKVVLDVFWDVQCSNCGHGLSGLEWVRHVVKAAVAEVGDIVILREHQLKRADRVNYGIGDEMLGLINGKKWLDPRDFDIGEDPEQYLQEIIELALKCLNTKILND